MGVDRKVLDPGNGIDMPNVGDTVRLEYTGYLFDVFKGANDHRGAQYVMMIVSTHNVHC